MEDYLVRGMTGNGTLRGLACITTDLVNVACRKHDTYPTAAIALGRALTGGALMGALLKDEQRVALKFEGNGPLKKILVEADSRGTVRGYVGVPHVDVPLKNGTFDVAGVIGHAGFLTVTKDLQLKEPYKGVVQLRTSEIAQDLAYYLTESEQIPSAIGLGAFIEASGDMTVSGGFLIQTIPPGDEELVESVIRHIQDMPSITELLRDNVTPEQLLELIFEGISFDIMAKQPLSFRCSCSKTRLKRALVTLGVEELTAMAHEKKDTEVICEFCRARYTFTPRELKRLLESIQ
ncbi:Hsp33 family molecular chaperone HslO [candidate division KSB3 bacterium]|uniref:33 kDa chaperonin n=1 Tax=candidate division KSB3 bacterium TaxID=2044937 RepID=A0A2G6KIY2_9BACT|nr:MAG: Hsp33 family molecular chaperone HslO [candidate division KSB3 bacterium]